MNRLFVAALLTALAAPGVGRAQAADAGPAAPAPGPGPGAGPGMGPGMGRGGMRGGGRGPIHFDPASVTTVSGEITAVNKVQGRRGQGTHLDLKTADGPTMIWLGPAWYLDRQPVKLAKGDAIEVTGSKNGSVVVAQTVKKGDATLTLRDARGIPAWSRGAR